MAGNLEVMWIHGAPDCSATNDPLIQVHRFDENTFILRQSRCSEPGRSFEAPFLYLLFGDDRALLLDTGASESPSLFPIGQTVRSLVDEWLARHQRDSLPLIVCHSHSHGDHAAGDRQFPASTGATVVPLGVNAVRQFFGIGQWPDQIVSFDLGGRTLEVIPIPGHERSHIALYDHASRLLLTGDTLYPGLLVINEWDPYRKSIERLKAFADSHEIDFILGAHIEMKIEPHRWFGLGATYQPGEHVLQLTVPHLGELHDALQAMGNAPRSERHADFIIQPASEPFPPADP